jgi:dethiobiotin synthetase
MMKKGFFVAGTDTEIGKTTVSLSLLKLFAQQGYATAALKPVASGATRTEQGLRNQDALQLQQAATTDLAYEQVNPFAFAEPISPNFAAAKVKRELTAQQIVEACQSVLNSDAEIIVIEGIGGWVTPINNSETMADVAKQLGLPVVLVVGIRLGCLNHSLLTYEAIRKSGLPLAGWMANQIDNDMLCVEENIAYLQQQIDAPLLGILPFMETQSNLTQIKLSQIVVSQNDLSYNDLV